MGIQTFSKFSSPFATSARNVSAVLLRSESVHKGPLRPASRRGAPLRFLEGRPRWEALGSSARACCFALARHFVRRRRCGFFQISSRPPIVPRPSNWPSTPRGNARPQWPLFMLMRGPRGIVQWRASLRSLGAILILPHGLIAHFLSIAFTSHKAADRFAAR